MKYSKFLLFMTVLSCLAFQACALESSSSSTMSTSSTMGSSGDYLTPNMGQVTNRTNPDEGLSGMLQWLNQPVPTFPWYTTGGSFYSQPYSETTFSPFTEYYTTSGTPVVGGIISNPTPFDITQKTPSRVYYGAGVGLPYSQYAAIVPSKTNDLWIQGATNWTQYVVSPVGTWLKLVANAPDGGPAGFYEMIQTGTTSSKYSTYQFNPGYNTMDFNADQVGRHMLYFVVNNQPSNVVVVDVFAKAQPGIGTVVPIAGQTQPIVLGGNSQKYYTSNGLTTTKTTSNRQITTTSDGTGTTVTSSSEFQESSSIS